MNDLLHYLHNGWRAGDLHRASHGERLLSTIGGFLGILAILLVSTQLLDYQGAAMVVASMGASAVLLFAVPHGALSQPWAVAGGQVISALVGVSCARYLDEPLFAAAAAVGLAIGAMHYLRCLHPPGGATALVAVLGGESVRQLGYQFALTPVLLNVTVILAVAVVFNLPFPWRRYPATAEGGNEPKETAAVPFGHNDLVYALSRVGSFVDVSEEDLIRIYTLAAHRARHSADCHAQGEECVAGEANCLCKQLSEAGSQDGPVPSAGGGIR